MRFHSASCKAHMHMYIRPLFIVARGGTAERRGRLQASVHWKSSRPATQPNGKGYSWFTASAHCTLHTRMQAARHCHSAYLHALRPAVLIPESTPGRGRGGRLGQLELRPVLGFDLALALASPSPCSRHRLWGHDATTSRLPGPRGASAVGGHGLQGPRTGGSAPCTAL